MSFEGSYMGANDRISDLAIMECKICWTPYDPSEGDDTRQIDAGVPFADLPGDWSCPTCCAPKEQFMVREDPGAASLLEANRIGAITRRLEADFREIYNAKMRDVPIVNKSLQVEAVGFARHGDTLLGVLVSPWFMNLILLPDAGQDWSGLKAGRKEVVSFPSGEYEFIHNTRETIGGYKACSLFSPMHDFKRHKDATDVARAVRIALFQDENRAETDRAADIRAAREDHVAAVNAAEDEADNDPAPTRRAVITGGLTLTEDRPDGSDG
ncbi:rubredoxin [Salipiger aestuarii]|uniref:[NiFe] hydrogenase assembly HybE family chaperone n=1 Tax=Salipiger aestuarii TaxID=568098 RepID=A0A327YKP2_9RHOB|nr:[NiFe]-hydrogenase assembly chaperone HybE [Salipiger aestuarii]EIE50146.1 rubredoxin HupJ [Citreicella sp. 357]KAA8609929.1 rubredoxin [Salipiger aestuarii]KAB2543188.1 rubredoxin [Salipiger aestuarii]RAK21513.1 [NiFe] hydrogenase assembly HybE family chaperone [Salipiger aestuarii]